jgi:hypothetical protein
MTSQKLLEYSPLMASSRLSEKKTGEYKKLPALSTGTLVFWLTEPRKQWVLHARFVLNVCKRTKIGL